MSVYQRPAPKLRKNVDISKRPLGVSSAKNKRTKPAQQPPKPDTSILVHDCHDQFGGEPKPDKCGCTVRIGKLDAASLIRNSKADILQFVRYGKVEKRRDSIVLRRDYVQERLLKTQIDPAKLLPEILHTASILSFKKGVIRAKNGAAISLETNRTDAHYWNSVLIACGFGAHSGQYLKNADAGKGKPVSFTKLENWRIAPIRPTDGVDPEIDIAFMSEVYQRGIEVIRRRHRVGASGVAQTSQPRSGGMTAVNGSGEIVQVCFGAKGNSRDSDERFGEGHEQTGQMDSRGDQSASLGAPHASDTRTLSKFRNLSVPQHGSVYSKETQKAKEQLEPEADNAI